MASRLNLQAALQQVMGSNKVYFSPPETIKLSYPCIVYSEAKRNCIHANSHIYNMRTAYEVTIIDKNPDSAYPDALLKAIPYCRHDTTFMSDNLTHFAFTIYI